MLTSVNGSGSVARFIAEVVEHTDWFRALKNVDGIVPIAHGSGVVMAGENKGADYKPVPCIKVASNSEMFAKMEEDMDLNASDILQGVTLEQKGHEMFEIFIRIASVDVPKSESLYFGGCALVAWQIGAVI